MLRRSNLRVSVTKSPPEAPPRLRQLPAPNQLCEQRSITRREMRILVKITILPGCALACVHNQAAVVGCLIEFRILLLPKSARLCMLHRHDMFGILCWCQRDRGAVEISTPQLAASGCFKVRAGALLHRTMVQLIWAPHNWLLVAASGCCKVQADALLHWQAAAW